MPTKDLYYLLSFFIINTFVFSSETTNTLELNILTYNNIDYIGLDDFISKHELHSNYYESKDKIEIKYKKNKIYFSPSISYCKINNQVYNLRHPIIYVKKGYYIPAKTFYRALELSGLPLRVINKKNNILYVNPNIYNINRLSIINKQNGTLIKLNSSKKFNISDISSSVSSTNWFNITILNCYLDTLSLNQSILYSPVSKIQTLQSQESAQISLLLTAKIEDIDIDVKKNEISFLLRNSIAENAKKINELRKKWLIDTIVIDAGHGGKDPGAIGHNIKEKNITLDIA